MRSTFIDKAIIMVLLTLYFLLVPAFGNEEKLKLISTCPAITEILYYLQLDENIIGVSNHCDYPKETKNKVKCAGMSLDLEKIISLKPDFVLIMNGFRNGEETILTSASLKVISLNLSNISQIVNSIKIIGKKFNRESLAKGFERNLKLIKDTISEDFEKPPLVYVETWGNPLMSVGNSSFISDIITAAGGKNIFSDKTQDNIQISVETILTKNPDIIIIAYPEEVKTIYKRPLFDSLNATKNKRVYKINPDLIVRPGPRILDGILELHNKFIDKK